MISRIQEKQEEEKEGANQASKKAMPIKKNWKMHLRGVEFSRRACPEVVHQKQTVDEEKRRNVKQLQLKEGHNQDVRRKQWGQGKDHIFPFTKIFLASTISPFPHITAHYHPFHWQTFTPFFFCDRGCFHFPVVCVHLRTELDQSRTW